jgi:HB1/ASXL restriction endonuclease-like protein with HTH domain
VDFKAAAREVLREVGHPVHYTDITEIALESGYLKSAFKPLGDAVY